VGNVAHVVGDMQNRVLMEKHEGKRPRKRSKALMGC